MNSSILVVIFIILFCRAEFDGYCEGELIKVISFSLSLTHVRARACMLTGLLALSLGCNECHLLIFLLDIH